MKTFSYKNRLGVTVLVDYRTVNGGVDLLAVYLFGCNRLSRLDSNDKAYIERVIMTEAVSRV